MLKQSCGAARHPKGVGNYKPHRNSRQRPRTIVVYTDSRITIEEASNRNLLFEEVRKQLTSLRRTNRAIEFSWILSHAGNPGNEHADCLAKDEAKKKNTPVVLDRIPKTTLYKKLEDETIQKLQDQWDRRRNAAITKQFFTNVGTGYTER